MLAEIRTAPVLMVAARTERLDADKLRIMTLKPLPDGTLMGILRGEDEEAEVTSMGVIVNWAEALEQKLRAAR